MSHFGINSALLSRLGIIRGLTEARKGFERLMMTSRGSGSGQVIAIGLEATDPGLIERWCREGYLPTFQSLMQQGAWRRLRSNPGKHGRAFYHRQLKCGTYRLRKKYAEETGRESFWSRVSRAGKRLTRLDVPASLPTSGFNGLQLVGWGAEGLNAPRFSWPAPLYGRITARYGRHPLDGWFQRRPASIDEWKSFSDKLLAGAKTRAAIFRELFAQERWDLFLGAFAEPHWAGHYFWHIIDGRHPDYDQRIAVVCGDTVRKIYQVVDQMLAELLEMAPQATFLAFSNTGMGPNYSGQHLLPEILSRLGFAGRTGQSMRPQGLSRLLPGRYTGPVAIRAISEAISSRNIEQIRRFLPERLWDNWTRWALALGSNWQESRAFSLPTDFSGAIRINLKGREPQGRVEPGAEYDAVCEEVMHALGELINPATGKSAVSEVVKIADRYPGEALGELPDIIVQWAGDAPINALTSPRIGTISGVLPEAHIMDVAPTIMRLMGQPASEGFDGRAMADVLS